MNFEHTKKQRQSFDSLVSQGVYSNSFDHAPDHKSFVQQILVSISSRFQRKKSLTILDCGCGTGSWLTFLHDTLAEQGFADIRCFGFDLSGNMVEVAREKLGAIASTDDIRRGDLLDPESYRFPGLDGGVDLLFSYDVIQQLPRRLQYPACEQMVRQVAPTGLALIFDNESNSAFGRRMAKRKFLTRYFGLPLVPRYYCNAAYPPLQKFKDRLVQTGPYSAEIRTRGDGKKRALIAENAGRERAGV